MSAINSTNAMIAVSKELKAISDELSTRIDAVAGHHICFSLVVFTEGRYSYVSNAQRADVAVCLQQMLDYWKAGTPDIPAHKVN